MNFTFLLQIIHFLAWTLSSSENTFQHLEKFGATRSNRIEILYWIKFSSFMNLGYIVKITNSVLKFNHMSPSVFSGQITSFWHLFMLFVLNFSLVKMVTAFQIVLPLVVTLSSVQALYTKSSGVVELTDNNFDNRVKDSDGVWIVEFYAPWCGHCQQLAPEYQKAAKALKGIINVGGIDCDVHKSLCGQVRTHYKMSIYSWMQQLALFEHNSLPIECRCSDGSIVKGLLDVSSLVASHLAEDVSAFYQFLHYCQLII